VCQRREILRTGASFALCIRRRDRNPTEGFSQAPRFYRSCMVTVSRCDRPSTQGSGWAYARTNDDRRRGSLVPARRRRVGKDHILATAPGPIMCSIAIPCQDPACGIRRFFGPVAPSRRFKRHAAGKKLAYRCWPQIGNRGPNFGQRGYPCRAVRATAPIELTVLRPYRAAAVAGPRQGNVPEAR